MHIVPHILLHVEHGERLGVAPELAHAQEDEEAIYKVPVTQVVAPGDSLNVPGEGLEGGELVLCFDVKFPKSLTLEQKNKIKALKM